MRAAELFGGFAATSEHRQARLDLSSRAFLVGERIDRDVALGVITEVVGDKRQAVFQAGGGDDRVDPFAGISLPLAQR